MQNLFEPATNQSILERIEKLTPHSTPLWGKMTVIEMLAHLDRSLQVNFGEIKLEKDRLRSLFRGVARRILLGEKPFPKNLSAPKPTLLKGSAAFEDELQKVKEKIRLYATRGPGILAGSPHNILGTITPEESATISYKHIDHHLRQFKV